MFKGIVNFFKGKQDDEVVNFQRKINNTSDVLLESRVLALNVIGYTTMFSNDFVSKRVIIPAEFFNNMYSNITETGLFVEKSYDNPRWNFDCTVKVVDLDELKNPNETLPNMLHNFLTACAKNQLGTVYILGTPKFLNMLKSVIDTINICCIDNKPDNIVGTIDTSCTDLLTCNYFVNTKSIEYPGFTYGVYTNIVPKRYIK